MEVLDRNGQLLRVGDIVRLWKLYRGEVRKSKARAFIAEIESQRTIWVRMLSTGKLREYTPSMVEKEG